MNGGAHWPYKFGKGVVLGRMNGTVFGYINCCGGGKGVPIMLG